MSGTFDPERLASPVCPAPVESDRITLSHGAGAGASGKLFEEIVWPRLKNEALAERHDGAVLGLGDQRLAFTTDTFVVNPIEFPGGDIGKLAVHGTVNDLAMCGARPIGLSCSLILEEGLPLESLARILDSLSEAARHAEVEIVTGDTKVVDRGKGDAIYINTAGVGVVPAGRDLRPSNVRSGDAILVSGPIGCHGAAVLSVREGLEFESEIVSDSAPLHGLVERLLEAVPKTSCLRDPTRGGLGAVVHEIASASRLQIELDEQLIPVTEPVRVACELLGLDPLFLACEGRLVAFVPEKDSDVALEALRSHPLGRESLRIGCVVSGDPDVILRTQIGVRRFLPLPPGDPLPRIC